MRKRINKNSIGSKWEGNKSAYSRPNKTYGYPYELSGEPLYGRKGGYQTILSSGTWKKPCTCCGSTIVKEAYLGGSVYYCPECQKMS